MSYYQVMFDIQFHVFPITDVDKYSVPLRDLLCQLHTHETGARGKVQYFHCCEVLKNALQLEE